MEEKRKNRKRKFKNTLYDIAMICSAVAVSQRPAMTADFTVKRNVNI